MTCIGTAIYRDDLVGWLQRHLQHEGRAAIIDYKVGAPGRPDHSAAKSGSLPAVERTRQKITFAWLVCQRANQPTQRGEGEFNLFLRTAPPGTFDPPFAGKQNDLRDSWNELFASIKKRGPIARKAWPKFVKIAQEYLAEQGIAVPDALPSYNGGSERPDYSYPPNL